MRSRIPSGTLGRPSGNLSPFQSGVYLITYSLVKNPCCAHSWLLVAIRTIAPIVINVRFSLPLLINRPILLCSGIRLKPRCSFNLHLFRSFLVHLDAKARLVCYRNVSLLNDLAFLHKILPGIQVVDPMPLADEEVRDGCTDMRGSHLP